MPLVASPTLDLLPLQYIAAGCRVSLTILQWPGPPVDQILLLGALCPASGLDVGRLL